MLDALLLRLLVTIRHRSWLALAAFARQTPRERAFAVVVILALIIDLGIPLLTLGCLSYGHCPLLHP